MAKVGEGDKRWLVEDRKDGTNVRHAFVDPCNTSLPALVMDLPETMFGIQVNSWHWAEKDVLTWAKTRLTELLGEHPLQAHA